MHFNQFLQLPHHWPNEKISLASWAIDLLSSKHFCCKKLTHLVISSLFWNSHLISWKKFANISFVLKFMQLITTPLLFYHFFLTHLIIISTNFYSDPHLKHDLTIPSFKNWSHSVYDNCVMFLILVVSNQIYAFT